MTDIGFRKYIEKLLASTLQSLAAADQTPFALLHYYWGNHLERGALRMSAVRPPKISDQEVEVIDLFQRHLRQFGQHFSLLRWVYFLALEKKKAGASDFQVIRFEMIDSEATIDIVETYGVTLHVRYSKALLARLCLENVVTQHKHNLESDIAKKDLRKNFAVALGHAKSLLKEDAISNILKELVPPDLPGQDNIDDDLKVVNFLTALQSACGFLKSVTPDLFDSNSIMDFYCLFGDGDDMPPLCTLFTLKSEPNNSKIDVVQKKLTEFLSAMSEKIDSKSNRIPNARDILICDKMKLLVYENGDREKELIQEWKKALVLLDQRFPLPKFVAWRDCVLTWITSLICHLRAKVHEGKKLEFWLAAGDLTEVLDSGQFELKRTNPVHHIAPVAVPPNIEYVNYSRDDQIKKARKDVDNLRDAAVRVASKENYVWFSNGRYALFWDLTSLDREPIGLLRPLDGNWEWYLERCAKEGFSQERWPELILGFERKDGSGGVRIGSEPVVSLAEQGKRVKFVRKWITEWRNEENIANSEADEILSDLIVRIADDPDAGCSVVFVNETPSQKFMKMGYPWGLLDSIPINKNSRANEIRRLMEMDGATCVWFDEDEWKIDFQFLLHGDEETISRWISEVKKNHELPLRGAGARRWSAAVAASHPIAGLVIVSSQDGDIYGFKKLCNGGLQMIESKKPDRLERTSVTEEVGVLAEPEWKTLISGEAGNAEA